jgi:5'-nucleotidase / UDP-sugar diphosphatase
MPRLQLCILIALTCLCAPAYGQTRSITILYTNDMHASFVPHDAAWIKHTPKPQVGGFKELEFTVDSVRRARSAVLLLDAGDVMTGNPITELEYGGAQGGALFEMMNRIGYDAWCPGNHDFDISQENLGRLTGIAQFPTLSANLVKDDGRYLFKNRPSVVIERGGMRIGIIGVMSQELYSLVNQNNLVGIRVLSPVETTQKEIDELRDRTDLLIALTHQGVDEDSMLAAEVTGLDVIIGGHSHTRLKKPKLINRVIIVQGGSNCENLGELELTAEAHHVGAYEGKLLQLWSRSDRPVTPLSTFIDSVEQHIDAEYSEVLATLRGDWVRAGAESGIAQFITDAQRDAAGADVAFMNIHGIRKDVTAGPLTRRDLFEVLPFRNVLTTFQLSGRQLLTALQYHLKEHTAIQTSGIYCQWKLTPEGDVDIRRIDVRGKPLEDERVYSCAASDFFVGEAKRYLGLELSQVVYLPETVFGAVEKQARRAQVIDPSPNRSIIRVK